MIVALCSTGESPESELDSRFGRCANFVYFDTEKRSFMSESNSARDAAGGAGAMAVQQIVNHGAGVLLAPDVGPQAMDALSALDITVFKQEKQKNGVQLIKAWENHRLEEQHKASAAGMHRV